MDEKYDCDFSQAYCAHGWAKQPDCQHPQLRYRYKLCDGKLNKRPEFCPMEEIKNDKDF
jgi:hypothetical protein